MKTIALRFGEHFAPACGTIAEHQKIIDAIGHVWYGKLGSAVSAKVTGDILQQDDPIILLINSGKVDMYWVHISAITKERPPSGEFPTYYHENAEKMKTWFKVLYFESAPKDIMAKCFVASSGSPLSEASRFSMSPYFIIRYGEEVIA